MATASPSAAPECPVCQLPLAEALQLHPQQHPCPFCPKTFGRVDAARRHARTCPHKGNRPLPPEAKRGRKLRACDQCSRVKVLCDAKTPCGRCTSRHQDCTYKWLCGDASHRQALARTGDAGRVPLEFLVAFTDPNRDFVTEQQLAGEPESSVEGPAARKGSPAAQEPPGCIDPMLLFSNFVDPYLKASLDDDGTFNDHGQDVLGPFSQAPPNGRRLASRVSLLAAELRDFASAKPKFRAFDWTAFTDLFSSANVHEFTMTFSRKRHYMFPIIHWPTFDLEEAPLPLLLSVALAGAAYSHRPGYHPDPAFRARDFYWIADAYVFKHLRACIESFTPYSNSRKHIELYQAGLLSFTLSACMNDDEMRRIVVTKRLPTLTAAMRRFAVIGARHVPSEDWTTFVERESCIRLVSWNIYADSMMVLFANSPPRIVLAEMNGHLPCSAELWDAESAVEFEERRAEEYDRGGFHCLVDLISGLLAEEWPGVDSTPYCHLHFHHLHAIICGDSYPLIPQWPPNLLLTSQVSKTSYSTSTHPCSPPATPSPFSAPSTGGGYSGKRPCDAPPLSSTSGWASGAAPRRLRGCPGRSSRSTR